MRPVKVETYTSKNYVYVIIRDHNAGRPRRFTTHRIALCGMNGTVVIGRELTLAHSRRIVKQEQEIQ